MALARKAASDKFLRSKTFNIAKNPKNCRCQRAIASMVYNLFDKKSASLTDKFAKGGGVHNEIKQNEEFSEELHKPIIKKI